MRNPFVWVEIYVADMQRAKAFYEAVLQTPCTEMEMPAGSEGMQMYSFSMDYNAEGSAGALVKMEGMNPGGSGTIVYFGCEDCSVELSRVETAGGTVIQEKMNIGEYGFCGLASDTEGNTIGFHSMQ